MTTTIIIPDYMRQVELSKSRLPIYYEVQPNGAVYNKKGKGVPAKMIDWNKVPDMVMKQSSNSFYEHLKDKYRLAVKTGTDFDVLPLNYGVLNAYNYMENQLSKTKLKTAKIVIFDYTEYKPVLSNPKAAGTPKLWTINGQTMYSGMNPNIRAKVMTEIKRSFIPYVKDLPFHTGYPYLALLEVHDTPENLLAKGRTDWDIGNRAYPYLKGMLDLLVTGKIDRKTTAISPKLAGDSILHNNGEGYRFIPITMDDTPTLKFKIKPIRT